MKADIAYGSFAAAALVAALICFAGGCGRDEAPATAPHPASPESYMNDKEFTGELAERQTEQRRLVRARNEVVQKMKAMIDAKRAELGTADEAKVKAELEKDPAWNELYKSCVEANTKIEQVRKGTLGVVRERLTRSSAAGSRPSAEGVQKPDVGSRSPAVQ